MKSATHPVERAVVLRFSAMGDVVLLLPSLCQVLAENPNLEIFMVSKAEFSPFFQGHPRLHFKGVSLADTYKGFRGSLRLARYIISLSPTVLIDQHQSIRSLICRLYAFFYGIQTVVIRKEKWKKIRATRRFWKQKVHLTHMTVRYADTWRRAGWLSDASLDTNQMYIMPSKEAEESILKKKKGEKWIGIAPFSQHKGKNWPIDYFVELIQTLLTSTPEVSIFMLGGRKEEERWQVWIPNSVRIHSLAQDSFDTQFTYLKQCDVLVCLDSSNFHLANMLQIPTVSIWGATHPSLGYGPFSLVENVVIQDDSLTCRPCTTYGKTTCFRGDFACLYQIHPAQVWEEVQRILNKHAFPG